VLDRLSLAELEVDALRRGSVGTYRVAAFPSAARTLLADAWRQLITAGAGVELRVSTPEPEAAIAALLAGTADLAVVHSYSNLPRDLPRGIESDPLAIEPVWVAIHADDPAAEDRIDLAALSRHDWIAPDDDVTCYEMIDRACGLAGFRPRIVAHSMDFAAQLEFVAAGAGVALVPDLTVAQIPDGVRLASTTSGLQRHIHVARRTSLHGDAGLQRIVGLLASAAQERIRPTVAL
jgi:DNA-binding transcriptional LysR family regulator